MKTEDKIYEQLSTHPIILYMKGVPEKPECGFSAKAVDILKKTTIPYAYVNVLAAPFIREKLPSISHWPTYPQLFVKTELVGGCDIIETMFNDGSLLPLLQSAHTESAHPESDSLSPKEITDYIQQGINDAQVLIEGAGCDLSLTVISKVFAGQSLVKKQQAVLATLKEPLASGKLHAVSVLTYTPDEWQSQSTSNGLLQIQV